MVSFSCKKETFLKPKKQTNYNFIFLELDMGPEFNTFLHACGVFFDKRTVLYQSIQQEEIVESYTLRNSV